ncbi:MAG: hypothetical protein S4CHLAM102_08110 [Chlamydiia bacterium]|nr:hypothetical protein [Chlamydiia bacterium]
MQVTPFIPQDLLTKTLQFVPAEMQHEVACVSREWHTAVLWATHLSALELLRCVGITIPPGKIPQTDGYSWKRVICEVHHRAHTLLVWPRHGFSRVPNIPKRVYCAMEFALLYPYEDQLACARMSWYVRSAREWGAFTDIEQIKAQRNRGAIAAKVAPILLEQGLVEQTRALLPLVDKSQERFNLGMRIVMAKDLAASRAEMMQLWKREENQGLEIEFESVESWVLRALEGGFADEVELFLSDPVVNQPIRRGGRQVMIKYYCDQKAFDQALQVAQALKVKSQTYLKIADAMFQAGQSEDANELIDGLPRENREHLIDYYIENTLKGGKVVERIGFFVSHMGNQDRRNQILLAHLTTAVEAEKYPLALEWIRGMVPLKTKQAGKLLASIAPASKCGDRPFVDECLALIDHALQSSNSDEKVRSNLCNIEQNTAEYEAEQGNFAPAKKWISQANLEENSKVFFRLLEKAISHAQYDLALEWFKMYPSAIACVVSLKALWVCDLNELADQFLALVEDVGYVKSAVAYYSILDLPELAFDRSVDFPVAERLNVLSYLHMLGEKVVREIFDRIDQLENPEEFLFRVGGAVSRILTSGLFSYFEKAMTYLTDDTVRNKYWKEGAMQASKQGRIDKALIYLQRVNADEYDGTYASVIEVYEEERCK